MPILKIESLEVVPLWIPITSTPSRRFESDAAGKGGISCVAVYLHTVDGPSGLGYNFEIASRPSTSLPRLLEDLAPLVVGQNALAPEALWNRIWSAHKPAMRAGLGVWALSAIDNACWDILAKAAGLPLHALLGGFTTTVPVYGSGGRRGLSDLDLVRECVEYADRGMTAYKFKVGGRDGSDSGSSDEERTALLRKEMGDEFTLYADANQAYNVREAIEVSYMLAKYGIAWFEEPVAADSVADLAAVAAKSAVPIAAGENAYLRWGFRDLCEQHAVSFIQPDIGRCGGVTEFRKVAHLAEAYNIALCSHVAPELSISLVGSSPNGYLVEYLEHAPPDLWSRPFEVTNGTIEIPDVAGHGVDLSPTARARYEVK
jgi:L-alanine-DL-glutamate epimerase-like enolase superfamily enzyme